MHGRQELPPAHEQELIAELIHALEQENWSAANVTEACLVERSTAAVVPLCHTLSFGTSEQRWRAARILGRIADARAVQSLCAALAVRPDPTQGGRSGGLMTRRRPNREALLRLEATTALGRIGSAEAVVPLCYALGDPAERVGWAARQALIAIGEPAVPVLCSVTTSQRPRVRQLAAGALGALSDIRGIAPLCEWLADPVREVRRSAAAAVLHFAQQHPARELRAALVPLRQLLTLRRWSAQDLNPRDSYRHVVEAAIADIERVVPDLSALPLPVQASQGSGASFPVPAAYPSSNPALAEVRQAGAGEHR